MTPRSMTRELPADLLGLATQEEADQLTSLVHGFLGREAGPVDRAALEEALAPAAYGVQVALGKAHPLLKRIKEGTDDGPALLAIWRDVLALPEPDLTAVRRAVEEARAAWQDHEEDEG